MYEKFTDRARKAMQMANMYAARSGSDEVLIHHMLIAVLNSGGVAPNILRNLNVVPGVLEQEIVDLLAQDGYSSGTVGESASNTIVKLPQSNLLKNAITLTIENARNMNSKHVGTEHMLLALADDKFKGTVAGRVIAKYITAAQIKGSI